MPTTLTISPVTRIEGHLDVEVTVDTVNAVQQVIDAKATASMFRGFENILVGRDPRDAVVLTQRICGVCPTSHGMASSMALERAFRIVPTDNGRIMRNLVLAADFLQSHILHFYHLAAPDYINLHGALDMSPWQPSYTAPDMIGGATAATLLQHYAQALDMRRKAHQMGAIFGGRMPLPVNFVPSGSSETVTAAAITQFRTLLDQIRLFIDNTLIPDAQALQSIFPQYSTLGRGYGNLLAYGVFDLDSAGAAKLLRRGVYTNGALGTPVSSAFAEFVKFSWYTENSGNLHPTKGVTEPSPDKPGAYSWIKAPRYAGLPHEVGSLARMWINGDYRRNISAMDRIMARALETKKIADALPGWLNSLQPGGPVYVHKVPPVTASGVGLTEAPRGALGHWVQIANSKVSRYQIITPTGWNASPRDHMDKRGPMEQALIGTPVSDLNNPVAVLRVVHSFDPCLACSVHAVRPGSGARKVLEPRPEPESCAV